MRLEIGNKVAVLDDVLKGIVTAISGDDVSVRTDDITYVFKAKELVKLGVEQSSLSKYSDINNPMLKEKIQLPKKKKQVFKKTKNEVVMEVDLHIEKLLNTSRSMDNFDILNYQLNTAKRKLEYCINKKISRLVFIHGVGEGVLKTELNYLLDKYPILYQDASYKQYGLGATEVYIFQNI